MKNNPHLELILIAACALDKNKKYRIIGKDNNIPWHIPRDLKRFQKLTLDHPVIMGRKTWESIYDRIGRSLPRRTNIVLTTKIDFKGNTSDIAIARTIQGAYNLAEYHAFKSRAFVIGGENIYRKAILDADKIYLTKIHKKYNGDSFFPEIKEKIWKETYHEDHLEEIIPFSYVSFRRKIIN